MAKKKKSDDDKEFWQMVDAGELVVPGAELHAERMPPILSGQATK